MCIFIREIARCCWIVIYKLLSIPLLMPFPDATRCWCHHNKDNKMLDNSHSSLITTVFLTTYFSFAPLSYKWSWQWFYRKSVFPSGLLTKFFIALFLRKWMAILQMCGLARLAQIKLLHISTNSLTLAVFLKLRRLN